MFDGNISPRFPKSHNFQPLPSSKSTGSRASASRRTWQVEVLSYDHTERLPNCYWLYLIVMIVLAFKDGEVYRCDINILFLPQLMSLHQKKHHRTTYDGQKLKWKKCLKSWPKAPVWRWTSVRAAAHWYRCGSSWRTSAEGRPVIESSTCSYTWWMVVN